VLQAAPCSLPTYPQIGASASMYEKLSQSTSNWDCINERPLPTNKSQRRLLWPLPGTRTIAPCLAPARRPHAAVMQPHAGLGQHPSLNPAATRSQHTLTLAAGTELQCIPGSHQQRAPRWQHVFTVLTWTVTYTWQPCRWRSGSCKATHHNRSPALTRSRHILTKHLWGSVCERWQQLHQTGALP